MKATVIDVKDNVAVILGNVEKGECISWKKGEQSYSAKALGMVPIYHKIAVEAIEKGKPIIKYGEHIGIAARNIEVGEHVHEHNVQNNREAL